MADLQSWRDPRPAPNLAENPAKTPTPRTHASWKAWWPAIAWAGVIFWMSTDTFSTEHTAGVFEPVLRWLFPGRTQAEYDLMHHIIRKCAHFAEYFVFLVLLYRAIRGGRTGWHWTWGLIAFLIAAGYSVSDEFHQSYVPSRGASAYDSLLDSIGALAALAVLWLWFRLRQKAKQHVPG